MKLSSYPKIYALGNRVLANLFDGLVVIQEKIDGSQFSFGIREGKLWCRSKNVELDPDTIDESHMFYRAVQTAKESFNLGVLEEGWTVRGEFLKSPKHNTLKYSRVPNKHLILFDVEPDNNPIWSPKIIYPHVLLHQLAKILGLEAVPTLSWNIVQGDKAVLQEFLKEESVLGGTTIEGIVIKNYSQFDPQGHVLMGKLVREDFKELNDKNWKLSNGGAKSVLEQIVENLKTEARWKKAVQRVRDAGELQNRPQDIPLLLKSVALDTKEECETEIKEFLFNWAWKTIHKNITKGLPEWYKEQLNAENSDQDFSQS